MNMTDQPSDLLGCGGKNAVEPFKALKPCPFCGSLACLHRRRSKNNALPPHKTGWIYWVHCTDCGANFRPDGTPDRAIGRWNSREHPNTRI